MACKINLFQCIVNEGLKLLQKAEEPNLEKEENHLKDIKIYLDELRLTNPELYEVPINPKLIDDLHKVSDDIKQTYIRKKERRDSYKEKRRGSLTSRRSSLEDSISTDLRRQSESSINFRRRSSGNVDSFQNRFQKNPNNLSNNKQQSSKTNDHEKIFNSQKRCDFYKSKGYHFDSANSNFRRKSSSASTDSPSNRPLRNLNSPKQKQKFFDGPYISETIKETSNEMEKPVPRHKSGDFEKSNDFQNRSARRGSAKPIYKRFVSWSGNTAHEQTNWRKKDDE